MRTCDYRIRPPDRMALIIGLSATLLGCLCTGVWLRVEAARAADVKADAPRDHVVLRHTPGGAYFVAGPLKEEYDRLLARVQSLQADLDAERANGPDVLVELKDLRPRLD